MQLEWRSTTLELTRPFHSVRPLLVSLLFVTAFGVRLYHSDQPPLDFHAVRQYHSLLIARSYYYEQTASIPEWRQAVASLNRQRQEVWEPPIMELITSYAYRAVGGERFWVPRVLTSLCWLVGGSFLYLLARRIAPPNAALASAAFYLLLPFGVTASRSFQPEPLLMMSTLISVFTIARYYENPSLARLLTAAIVSSLAIVVKGIGLFPILSVFLAVGAASKAHHSKLLSWRSGLFVVLSLVPAALFYSYRLFVVQTLAPVAQGDILPNLLYQPFFWKGWIEQVGSVVGYPALLAAVLGTLMLRGGLPRGLLMGLWLGYLLFGLVFTYTIYTHDYWNLQVVPVVALGVGMPVALVIDYVRQHNAHWVWRGVVWATLAAAVLLDLALARPRELDAASEHKIAVAQEIGALVNHSSRTVFLSPDYGLPLEYHGELAGVPWPILSDLEWERLAGVPPIAVADRFDTLLSNDRPEYFIVLDYQEYDGQPELRDFLTEHFPVRARGDDYLVFDMRNNRAR